MCVIFLDGGWVVHIPFVRMVKFKFLAHFPVDHLAHPIMSSLIFLVLICCIQLLCDWWFHLCHCIAYICYFVESYLLSLWFDWFLWLLLLLSLLQLLLLRLLLRLLLLKRQLLRIITTIAIITTLPLLLISLVVVVVVQLFLLLQQLVLR